MLALSWSICCLEAHYLISCLVKSEGDCSQVGIHPGLGQLRSRGWLHERQEAGAWLVSKGDVQWQLPIDSCQVCDFTRITRAVDGDVCGARLNADIWQLLAGIAESVLGLHLRSGHTGEEYLDEHRIYYSSLVVLQALQRLRLAQKFVHASAQH